MTRKSRNYEIPAGTLLGKTVVVTGANFGIGKSIALNCALNGAKVILACRSIERATVAKEEIEKIVSERQGTGTVEIMQVDISNMESVRMFAKAFLERREPLHVLVNNAGLVQAKNTKTSEGFELHFSLALGHFLLSVLLIPALRSGSMAGSPSRIVTMASSYHRGAFSVPEKRVFGDKVRTWEFKLEALQAYARSKLANIHYSRVLGDKLKSTGIHTYALHPGHVASGIWQELPRPFRWLVPFVMLSEEQGAATALYCATSPDCAKDTSKYYRFCALGTPSSSGSSETKAADLVEKSLKWLTLDYGVFGNLSQAIHTAPGTPISDANNLNSGRKLDRTARASMDQRNESRYQDSLDKDVSAFVQYLLEGSGSERNVDYSAIKNILQRDAGGTTDMSFKATMGSDMSPSDAWRQQTRSVSPHLSESVASDLVTQRFRERSNYTSARESIADPRSRVSTMLPRSNSAASSTSELMRVAREAIAEEVELRKLRSQPSNNDMNAPISPDEPGTPRPRPASRPYHTPLEKQLSGSSQASGFASGSGPTTAIKIGSNSDQKGSSNSKRDLFGAPDTIQSSSRESQVPQPNSLQPLSQALMNVGMPTLHPCLLYAPTIRYPSSSPLSEKQQEAIRDVIKGLMNDLERREETVQTLLSRLNEMEERSLLWEDRAWSTEQKRMEEIGTDSYALETLKDELKSKSMEATRFAVELASTRSDLDASRNQAETLKRRLANEEAESENLRFELASMKEQAERTRSRNERTFAAITSQYRRDPSKSGLDRLTLEVIEVYERKLLALEEENSTLRSNARSHQGQSIPRDAEQRLVDINDEISRLKHRTQVLDTKVSEDEAFLRMESAMSEQISELKEQLAETRDELVDARREADLLRLKMLAMKDYGEVVEKDSNPSPKATSTRALIRRHKKAWKLKLYKIDAMGPDESRDLLKDICVKLNINDIDKLLASVDTVDQVVKLVPQMQRFIEAVDTIVWRAYVKTNGVKHQPHKLSETLAHLERWSSVSGDIDVLRDFRERILSHLRIEESPQSTMQCMELLRRMSINANAAGSGRSDEPTPDQLVKHFRDLFEVDSQNDVYTRINELYVFSAEVQKGLRNLAEALKAPSSLSPGGLLARAVEANRVNDQPTPANEEESDFKLHSSSDDEGVDREDEEDHYHDVDIGIEDEVPSSWRPLASTLSGLERLLGRKEV
ncbi:hypothetical protein SmJEL517_g00557 [Synchytrium microbalum]|uniref:Uncharacterized protein n=1 Tax=Synchytrium microbalum TaxID=1806994 RepID=A0A507CEB1_9FUNG|nr:uncharacterized protein SmJEL517_g00557 [Synchytrium microbalum]TPX37688.1 hypothetical protein SmJEL517_g00557 [Synchytrium microbalum]